MIKLENRHKTWIVYLSCFVLKRRHTPSHAKDQNYRTSDIIGITLTVTRAEVLGTTLYYSNTTHVIYSCLIGKFLDIRVLLWSVALHQQQLSNCLFTRIWRNVYL